MLIGLIGKKRAGKDTFARELTDRFGVRRFAFADPLRAALLELDPVVLWTPEASYLTDDIRPVRLGELVAAHGWETAKEEFPEVRRLMQNYGVGIRRIDPDFWLRATMEPVRVARFAEGRDVIITDVRFPNEADAIKADGGTLVRIVRPGLASDDTHESETALDNYLTDYTVQNDSAPDLLAFHARQVFRNLDYLARH